MVAADQDRNRGGLPFVRFAVGFAFAGAIAAGAWLTIAGAPTGGEPVVIASIPPEPEIAVESVDVPIRATVPPETELPGEQHSPGQSKASIRIIDPSAGMNRSDIPVELARAPFSGLAEATEFGLLPRISDGGRKAWKAYARPAPPVASGPGAPVRAALMVTGLGISAKGTSDIITRLPPEISLAFAPYGNDLQTWADRARSNGHEVFLQVPMEPFDYPDNDPGPHTLLTNLDESGNIDRLHWLLGRFAGYCGITNYMGAKLTSSPETLRPVMSEIASRGLSYLDDGTSSRSQGPDLAREFGAPATSADVTIAADETREGVLLALERLEAVAKERGQALGVATALPITVDTIIEWEKELEQRGVILVPASALVNDQTG